VAAALSPRLVKHMETLIAEYADRLIDGFASHQRGDAGGVSIDRASAREERSDPGIDH
jgi:cytochrome P450